MKRILLSLAIVATFTAGCASMSSAPAKSEGGVLVGPNGKTLYTFDKDPAGVSVCVDKCAILWPPMIAAAGDSASGDWTIIARKDNTRQWAYKGKALYYWIKDQKPGDRTGDGVNNVWRVARP